MAKPIDLKFYGTLPIEPGQFLGEKKMVLENIFSGKPFFNLWGYTWLCYFCANLLKLKSFSKGEERDIKLKKGRYLIVWGGGGAERDGIG